MKKAIILRIWTKADDTDHSQKLTTKKECKKDVKEVMQVLDNGISLIYVL